MSIDAVLSGARAWHIQTGDVLDVLATIPDESIQCVVTSPPYWGLRDYGVAGALGLESTPDEFVDNMVKVFAEVRRVLRADGTLWLNLGDCYNSGTNAKRRPSTSAEHGYWQNGGSMGDERVAVPGLKVKDLVGMPWRVAFALQADGWWLRSDIVWSKPNPMPESVTDRPTKAHEYLFLLTKSARYFYDADAIRESASENTHSRGGRDVPANWNHQGFAGDEPGARTASNNRSGNKERKYADAVGRPDANGQHLGRSFPWEGNGRSKRTVWEVATEPFAGGHFATFPKKLVEPCILAGSGGGVCRA